MRATISMTLVLIAGGTADAGIRKSASYAVAAEAADAGGQRTASANYSNDGSVGGVAGVVTAAASEGTVKNGYIGQLYEVTALRLAASPVVLEEGGVSQLRAWLLLDDDTRIDLAGSEVTWGVQAGPLAAVGAEGLARAARVYADAAATVVGSYGGNSGTVDLSIVNVSTDDFGTYAADGIDDAWQVQYFGVSNPEGVPGADPDYDGQTNLFEFTAGLVPVDGASRFGCRVEEVAGDPTRKRIVFGPWFANRTYRVFSSEVLVGGSWSEIADGVVSDEGNERVVVDVNADAPARFYRVQILKP